MPSRKYPKDELAIVVSESESIREVMRHFNLRITGGSSSRFRQLIREYELDVSHFVGSAVKRGGGPKKRTSKEVLVLRSPDDYPEKASRLRLAMVEGGFAYRCEVCSMGPEWQGLPITLEIDHRNGRRWDNREFNLRFLCPNCHSQTETFGNKNKMSVTSPTAEAQR